MDVLCTQLVLSVFWMPFFNIGMGISPVTLGFILMTMRLWDGFNDPIMGVIADNARTRWGRRRPFMLIGAILSALMFPVLWLVPESATQSYKAIYLTVTGLLFFTCTTCWAMPYYSMQMELTPNYDERTRISAWLAFFSKFAGLLAGWSLALVTSSWFANPETGKPDIIAGVRACSWAFALAILLFGLLPALFVRERYYESEVKFQAKDAFWASIKESAKCRPLWNLIGICFFLVLGTTSVISLSQYVNIYYVNGGDIGKAAMIGGWKATTTTILGIATIPLWSWLSERLDKKIIVMILLGVSAFGHLLNMVFLIPGQPYFQLIPAAFESCAIGAVWLILPSMKADIADYDELNTSKRREGSLNAFYSWFLRMAGSCALGLGGIVLESSGFVAAKVEQDPQVLERMKWLYIGIPVAIWSLSFVFIAKYPLNRKTMTEIRGSLEARRGRI